MLWCRTKGGAAVTAARLRLRAGMGALTVLSAGGFLTGLLAMGILTACVLFFRERGAEDQMLDYMRKKYGEVFVDEEAYGGQPGKAYTMRRMHSLGRPEESILVRALGREEVVFQDNYLAYLLRDDIEERMHALAGPVFGKCKVYYRIPALVFPPEFAADMEADEFLKNPLSMVRVYIYVRDIPADVRAQLDAFLSSVAGKNYVVGGVVSYPAGKEMYDLITPDNFTGDIYQGYESVAEAVFSMDEAGGLSYLEWKGEIADR